MGKSLGALTGEGQAFSLIDPNAKSPYVEQYSLDIQREVARGHRDWKSATSARDPSTCRSDRLSINDNALNPSLLSLGCGVDAIGGQSFLWQRRSRRHRNGHGSGVAVVVALSGLQLHQQAYSRQQQGQVRFDGFQGAEAVSHGVTFLSSFTWSRNWDESSGGAGNTLNSGGAAPQNPYNMAAEYAFSNIDSPFRWSSSVSYELPSAKEKRCLGGGGISSNILGGWIVNAVSIFQTGFPLQITQSTNYNSGFGYASQRPNATGVSPATSGSLESRLNDYINPAAFSRRPEFTFGNVGRTIDMRGPGQVNWDMSVFKNFSIKERLKSQFRTEALNAMNTPLFYGPSTSFGSSSFGKITSQANFSRQLQLALRFSF